MVWLDNSRVIAIFAVVLLHSAAGVVVGSDLGTMPWWIGNFYDSFARWCVPVFVMISGSLLLSPAKTESMELFYTKRIKRILIPIIFWSLFFLLWIYFKGGVFSHPFVVIKLLLSGAPYYHMWFLYMIVFLYLFTPFFRVLVSNLSRSELTVLTMLMLFLAVVFAVKDSIWPSNGPSLFIFWFLSYIPYFFLGHLIRVNEKSYSRIILWLVFLVSVLLTAVGCYFAAIHKGLDFGLYFYGYLSVTVVPMSISFMYLLKSWGKPLINVKITAAISSLTLGAYLIHPVFLEAIYFIGFSPTKFNPLWSIPLVAIVAFALSLMLSYIISRIRYLNNII